MADYAASLASSEDFREKMIALIRDSGWPLLEMEQRERSLVHVLQDIQAITDEFTKELAATCGDKPPSDPNDEGWH